MQKFSRDFDVMTTKSVSFGIGQFRLYQHIPTISQPSLTLYFFLTSQEFLVPETKGCQNKQPSTCSIRLRSYSIQCAMDKKKVITLDVTPVWKKIAPHPSSFVSCIGPSQYIFIIIYISSRDLKESPFYAKESNYRGTQNAFLNDFPCIYSQGIVTKPVWETKKVGAMEPTPRA